MMQGDLSSESDLIDSEGQGLSINMGNGIPSWVVPSSSFPSFPGDKSPRVTGSSVAASAAQVRGEGQSNAWDWDLEPHFERSSPRRVAWAVDTLKEAISLQKLSLPSISPWGSLSRLHRCLRLCTP